MAILALFIKIKPLVICGVDLRIKHFSIIKIITRLNSVAIPCVAEQEHINFIKKKSFGDYKIAGRLSIYTAWVHCLSVLNDLHCLVEQKCTLALGCEECLAVLAIGGFKAKKSIIRHCVYLRTLMRICMDCVAALFTKLNYNKVGMLLQANCGNDLGFIYYALATSTLLNVYRCGCAFLNAASLCLSDCVLSMQLNERAVTSFFSVGCCVANINIIVECGKDLVLAEKAELRPNSLTDAYKGMFFWELLNFVYRHRYADFIIHMHKMHSIEVQV